MKKMKYRSVFTKILILVLISTLIFPALAESEYGSSGEASGASGVCPAGPLVCSLEIPLDKDRASSTLVAGDSWVRGRVVLENTGSETLEKVRVSVGVPAPLEAGETSSLAFAGVFGEEQLLKAEIGTLSPGENKELFFDVKPPASVEFKKNLAISLRAEYGEGEEGSTLESKARVSLVPPPSWLTYLTILASLLLFIGILAGARRLGVLDLFSTVDLITIALLAAVIAVVFRYISKLVNLGWFDGLVVAIPTVVLMIVALQLVRKPGTATLLFTCVLLISMVVWGSHIMWLGFYLAEGVIVDLLVFLFKMDYADRRLTAIFYGVSRCAASTLVFYLLYAPVEWKISYAPWYIGLQLAIACVGGLIGGSLGYDTAVKMSGARL